jgi:SAM-dependent methyltransferase
LTLSVSSDRLALLLLLLLLLLVAVGAESPATGAVTLTDPTYSLGLRCRGLLRQLILRSQGTRVGPLVTPQTRGVATVAGAEFAAAQAEYDDGDRLMDYFGGGREAAALAAREVLDLGCGYGGRTVYYARSCAAARVTGLEVSQAMVDRGRAFAEAEGCSNVFFDLGAAESLPYDDGAFDVVASFDVLEHVVDPFAALREIARVLRPGGRAYLVYPTYLGARSSHLDYVTRVPALHRVFDPEVIVTVVNSILMEDPARFGIARQPAPIVSALGVRTLPTLNGLTLNDAKAAIAEVGLVMESLRLVPFVRESDPIPGARLISGVLAAWQRRSSWPELFVGSVAMRLSATVRSARD